MNSDQKIPEIVFYFVYGARCCWHVSSRDRLCRFVLFSLQQSNYANIDEIIFAISYSRNQSILYLSTLRQHEQTNKQKVGRKTIKSNQILLRTLMTRPKKKTKMAIFLIQKKG